VKSRTRNTSTTAALTEGANESYAQAAITSKYQVRAWRQWLVVLALIFSDILSYFLFWGLALVLQWAWGQGALSGSTGTYILFNTALWTGLRALLGLYPGYGLDPVEELRRQTYATIATLGIAVVVFVFAFEAGSSLSRLMLGLAFLESLLVVPIVRHFVKWGLMKLGLWGKPVVVLGAGETGKQLVRTLQREWGLGFRPVAVFDFRLAPRGGLLEGVPYGGTVSDALDLARKQRLDTIIFAMPHIRREHLAKFVERASYRFRRVILIPNLSGLTTSAVAARDFSGTLGVEIKHNLLNPWVLRAKRLLDLAATLVGGILILPLLLTICLLVWVDSRGPIFYKAERIGRDQKRFSCIKFQTMVPDAETILQRLLEENDELREEYSKYHKLRDDPRVTRIGRFLRKTSLDELPQLWNVLRGEMSLVGPRPYLPRESEKIGAAQSEILRVPPGITGPWQVAGRNSIPFEERVQMDAYYVRDWSGWIDLILLSRTIRLLVFGRWAY
jgi:Undecaprenyl-phosphate galactose phosphotransferase WbaP